MIKFIAKEQKLMIAKYLSHFEFRCKCGHPDCTFTILHQSVAIAFDGLRVKVGKPLHITSGFRCQRHNKEINGSPRSFHMKGMAIDIVIPEGVPEFSSWAGLFFEKVIVYKDQGFIHCDVRGK